MSEEMNLYKRCKNIFKAHGVDMGGGGGSGVTFLGTVTEDGWTGPDVDVNDIRDRIMNGEMFNVLFIPDEEGEAIIMCSACAIADSMIGFSAPNMQGGVALTADGWFGLG